MYRLFSYLLLTAFFLKVLPVFSQAFTHRFQTWNYTHGLTTNICNSLAQDKKGYLYVASGDGLHRFNSNNFKLLTNGLTSKERLGNIDNILIDDDHRLWFASSTNNLGVGVLNLSAVQPIKPAYYSFEKVQKTAGQLDAKVRKLSFDSSGQLWAGTHGNGLYKFDTAAKKSIAWPVQNPYTNYPRHIRYLWLYKKDMLFVGLVNGLSIINPITEQTKHVQFIVAATGEEIKPTVRKVMPWHLDTFVLATDRGLWFLHLTTGHLSEINSTGNGLRLSTVSGYDAIQYSAQEIWFATENDGVLFFNTQTGRHAYSHELQVFDEGVPKGTVNALFKDKHGNIWVAHDFGLSLYRHSYSHFMNFAHDRTYPNVPGILVSDGNHLVAFDDHHLSRFDIVKGLSQQASLRAPPEYKYPSYVFRHDSLGYVTFYNKHFFVTRKVPLTITELPVKPIGFAFDTLGHFRVMDHIPVTLNRKNLWLLHAILPYGSMMLLYDPVTGRLWEEKWLGAEKRPMISKVLHAPGGKFWISTTEKGIYYSEVGAFNRFINLSQASTKGALPNNNVSDLMVDGNAVWATVYGAGLVRIEPKPDGTFHFQLFNKGLDDPFLFRMVPFGADKIWITALNGLLCFDKKTGSFRRFSLNNGIRNTKFQLFDTFYGSCGQEYLYFSDRSNLIVFKPDSVLSQVDKPRLVLNGVESGAASYNSIYNSVSPEFAYQDNTIAFTYDVLNYENEQNVLIKYKLDGFDKEWTQTSDFSKIIYRQLPNGQYRFTIQLLQDDDSTIPAQHLSFVIATPWFKRWWFYTLCGLAVVLLVYTTYNHRVQQKLQVVNVRNRLHRDLHDDVGATLSSIKAYSEILGRNGNDETINHLIKENATEMIDRLEVIAWATNPQHDKVKSLVDAILKIARPLMHASNIAFDFIKTGIADEAVLPGHVRQNILLVCKEALNNLVKYASATECKISIIVKPYCLVLQISDNGKGWDGTIRGGGAGFKNMKKRAEEMGGTLVVNACPGQGTLVCLTVPYPFKIPNTWDSKPL